jgi:hypothetical protein
MKFLPFLIVYPTIVLSAVLQQTKRAEPFTEYLPLTLTFTGGPSSYKLDIRADGQTYNTSSSFLSFPHQKFQLTNPPPPDNALSVSQISTSGFDIWTNCNLYTTGFASVASSPVGNGIQIGPPAPIIAVACRPTPAPPGTCLPVYGKC